MNQERGACVEEGSLVTLDWETPKTFVSGVWDYPICFGNGHTKEGKSAWPGYCSKVQERKKKTSIS